MSLTKIQQRLAAFQIKLSLAQIRRALTSNKTLFSDANRKLGKRILTFGIPAVITCPGRTEVCSGGECPRCYATKAFFKMGHSQDFKLRSLICLLSDDFVARVVTDLSSRRQRVIRVHDAGDFYSAEYIRKWLLIIHKLRATHRFFAYTRSWRIPRLRNRLEELADRKNVRLFYSVDSSSEQPDFVPASARLAWLQTEEEDISDYPVDLVFRDYKLRGSLAKSVNGVLVCPYENGVAETSQHFNCGNCGLCWDTETAAKDPRKQRKPESATRRLPLRLL